MDWNSVIDPEALLSTLLGHLPNVLVAVFIFSLSQVVYKLTHKPIELVFKRAHFEQSLINILVHNIYRVTLLVLGVLMAASQLGIDVGAALAGLGIAGIAIGFASQDVLSSIIAGFMIFFDKPFKVGDWIIVGDHYGKVTEITIRSTRIQTLNNTYVVIPNKIIVDEVLDNHSLYGETRIEVPIGIAYKENIPEVRQALMAAIQEVEHVLKDPAPDVVVEECGDSSVNLIVRVWIHDAAVEKQVFYATMETCKLALDAAGIEIPFPHLQLFVDDVKQRAVDQLKQVAG